MGSPQESMRPSQNQADGARIANIEATTTTRIANVNANTTRRRQYSNVFTSCDKEWYCTSWYWQCKYQREMGVGCLPTRQEPRLNTRWQAWVIWHLWHESEYSALYNCNLKPPNWNVGRCCHNTKAKCPPPTRNGVDVLLHTKRSNNQRLAQVCFNVNNNTKEDVHLPLSIQRELSIMN